MVECIKCNLNEKYSMLWHDLEKEVVMAEIFAVTLWAIDVSDLPRILPFANISPAIAQSPQLASRFDYHPQRYQFCYSLQWSIGGTIAGRGMREQLALCSSRDFRAETQDCAGTGSTPGVLLERQARAESDTYTHDGSPSTRATYCRVGHYFFFPIFTHRTLQCNTCLQDSLSGMTIAGCKDCSINFR